MANDLASFMADSSAIYLINISTEAVHERRNLACFLRSYVGKRCWLQVWNQMPKFD